MGVPKSLDHFRVVRWSAGNSVENRSGLPVWSVSTLFAFMGARPDRYRDWPNVSEWIADGAKRVVAQTLRTELAGQARSAWARTSYLLFVGGQDEMADALLAAAPPGGAPFHLGPRDMPSKYSAWFEVADHVFPTWWSIKATTPLPTASGSRGVQAWVAK